MTNERNIIAEAFFAAVEVPTFAPTRMSPSAAFSTTEKPSLAGLGTLVVESYEQREACSASYVGKRRAAE